MGIKISNSATNMLETCPKMYEYHYKDRIRSTTMGSALVFGIAMDNALNALLMSKLKVDPKIIDHKQTFLDTLLDITINEHKFDATDCQYIQYSKSDLDLDLLEKEDMERIKAYCDIFTYETIDTFVERHQAIQHADAHSIKTYNYIAWHCVYRRGLLLIDTYVRDVFSTIDYVESIQEQVSLPNSEGDEITGVIDAIIKFKDDDNLYICDNKTSSTPYKQDDLTYSKQLATYAEYKGIYNVAYLVMEKKIRKKEPRARTQILKGTLENDHIENVFENYQESLQVIKNKVFDMNLDKCYNQYGRKCVYFNLCKNNNPVGLVKLEKKSE